MDHSEPDTRHQSASGPEIKAEPVTVEDSAAEGGFECHISSEDDRQREVDFKCDFTYAPGSSGGADLSSSPLVTTVGPESSFVNVVSKKKQTPDCLRISLCQSSANTSDAQQPQHDSYRCQRCFAAFELFSFFKQHMASVHGESIQDMLAVLQSAPESFQAGGHCGGDAHIQRKRSERKIGDTRNLERTDSNPVDVIDRTLVEKDGKQHVCEVCNKAFARVDSLKRHKMIHIGLKQFECDQCGKAFTQAGHLREHKLTHTGQKQFVCKVCNKAFSRSDNLKTHMLIHTGEKQFVCYVCFKAFTLSHHLEQHKLIHSGIRQHVCDVCNRAFIESGHLKRHKLIHVSQKDFLCDVCNKAFAAPSKLKQHKTIHTRHK